MTAAQVLDEIYRMPVEDRAEVLDALTELVVRRMSTDRDIDEVFERYRRAMLDTSGVDCKERSRRPRAVWARNIVVVKMMEDGFTHYKIAERVGLDHSTMVHCRNSVKAMLQAPQFYVAERKMYRNFLKAIQ